MSKHGVRGFGPWSVLICALAQSACSDRFTSSCADPSSCGGSGAAQGGAAGEADSEAEPDAGTAGDIGPSCVSDSECDDGLRCNGAEVCMEGRCLDGASPACDNASTCVESTTAPLCSYPDASPWLAYAADEDKPGFNELYVVKESLIGEQQPIKVSGTPPAAVSSFGWSANGTWLTYSMILDESSRVNRVYAVHFGDGIPGEPVLLTKDTLVGETRVNVSETGQYALLQVKSTASILKLGTDGSAKPIALNLPSQIVTDATWVLRGSGVIYVTKDDEVYLATVSDDGTVSRAALNNALGAKSLQNPFRPTSDGRWLPLMDENGVLYLVKASAGAPILPVRPPGGGRYTNFAFSSDSHYLSYERSEKSPGQVEVYLVDLLQEGLPRVTIQEGIHLSEGESMGVWSPDSSFLTLYREDPSSPYRRRLRYYYPKTKQLEDIPYSIGIREAPVGYHPSQPWLLLSNQHSPDAPTELLAVGGNGFAATLDRNEKQIPYLWGEFAADGSALAVCSRITDDVFDMVFLDLRRGFNSAHAIRMPGEGSAGKCFGDFATDSKGLSYYRVAPDGSQALYYADASKQVLGKPIKVTREGRVYDYEWQPLPKLTN